MKPVYRRILIKISGEALMGQDDYGINRGVLDIVSKDILSAVASGVQVAIVIGGGNIFRGVSTSAEGMDRTTADYMGMLATIINAMALNDALNRNGQASRVQSALKIDGVVESYERARAIRHLDKGRVVIFAGGTGNPYFTTDTAASLRALEIGADVLMKATKVDGVYDKDPMKHNDANRYDSLSYDEVLEKRLAVMDATAITLCRDNNLPLQVFNIHKPNGLNRVICGEEEGTTIRNGG